VVSAIRNGTEETARLASAVKQMERMLEQLSQMPPLSAVDEQQDFTELERLVRECSDDLSNFSNTLKKMHSDPSEGAIDKAWKGVKVSLKKEDLSRMWTVLDHHQSVLGFQLAMQYHRHTQQALLILIQRIDELPSGSTAQFRATRTISRRLQNQVGGMPTWRTPTTTPETQISPSHILSGENSVESRLEDSRFSHKRALSTIIQNLCQLGKLKPKATSLEMAQSIISDPDGVR
jgi:hypothetical protein